MQEAALLSKVPVFLTDGKKASYKIMKCVAIKGDK